MVLKRRNKLEYIEKPKGRCKRGFALPPGPCHQTGSAVQSPRGRLLLFPEPRRYRAGLPPDHLAGIEGEWIRVTPFLPCPHGLTPPRRPLPDPLLLLARAILVIWMKSDATATMTDPVHTATALPAG